MTEANGGAPLEQTPDAAQPRDGDLHGIDRLPEPPGRDELPPAKGDSDLRGRTPDDEEPPADALLTVSGLRKYFPIHKGFLNRHVGDVKAVDGVFFTLRRGETLGLVGESGCGKSTTGRSILRLIEPTAGRALFDGQDIVKMDKGELRRLRRRAQIVFQDPYSSLNPRMTIAETLREVLGIHKIAKGQRANDRIAELLRAVGPGLPGSGAPATFYIQRSRGPGVRLVAVVEPAEGIPFVRGWRASGDQIEVETTAGTDRHVNTSDGWEVTSEGRRVAMRGLRRTSPAGPGRPLIDHDRKTPMAGLAIGVQVPPALDGTLDHFDLSAPLELDHEDQYRRSEEPYAGPEEFSATAAVNWDGDTLYVGVEVRKPELVIRGPDALPLRLDNEPDDIHADGVQLYVRTAPDRPVHGYLVTPASEDGAIRVRGASETAADPAADRPARRTAAAPPRPPARRRASPPRAGRTTPPGR